MTSIRHNTGPDDTVLDAARTCLLDVGWRRTTLTDVARRAGVSRMTIYRRWPDTQTLLADLMTREWTGVVAAAAPAEGGPVRQRLVHSVTRTVRGLRENALFRKIVAVDPELLLPYLLDRRGRTQDSVLGLLEGALAEGQADGSVRAGDPAVLARALALAAHGFTLSAQTMTDAPAVDDGGGDNADGAEGADRPVAAEEELAALEAELAVLVDSYLAPGASR